MEESAFKIVAGEVATLNESFIRLDATNKQFSFQSKYGESKLESYCDLTDEEYKAFDGVFKRIVTNTERVD